MTERIGNRGSRLDTAEDVLKASFGGHDMPSRIDANATLAEAELAAERLGRNTRPLFTTSAIGRMCRWVWVFRDGDPDMEGRECVC